MFLFPDRIYKCYVTYWMKVCLFKIHLSMYLTVKTRVNLFIILCQHILFLPKSILMKYTSRTTNYESTFLMKLEIYFQSIFILSLFWILLLMNDKKSILVVVWYLFLLHHEILLLTLYTTIIIPCTTLCTSIKFLESIKNILSIQIWIIYLI